MEQLIWTRSQDDWAQDQALLSACGRPYLHLPCIKTQAVACSLPATRYRSVAFTSSKAVNYAMSCPELAAMLSGVKRCYTFGTNTARVIQSHGLPVVIAKDCGNGAEFSLFLSRHLARNEVLLACGPLSPAFDMVAALNAHEIRVDYLPLYETTGSLELSPTAKADAIRRLAGVVCFASPSAVEAFGQSLTPQTNRLGQALTAVSIGVTTDAVCRNYFAKVVVAERLAVESLLAKAVAELASELG